MRRATVELNVFHSVWNYHDSQSEWHKLRAALFMQTDVHGALAAPAAATAMVTTFSAYYSRAANLLQTPADIFTRSICINFPAAWEWLSRYNNAHTFSQEPDPREIEQKLEAFSPNRVYNIARSKMCANCVPRCEKNIPWSTSPGSLSWWRCTDSGWTSVWARGISCLQITWNLAISSTRASQSKEKKETIHIRLNNKCR